VGNKHNLMKTLVQRLKLLPTPATINHTMVYADYLGEIQWENSS